MCSKSDLRYVFKKSGQSFVNKDINQADHCQSVKLTKYISLDDSQMTDDLKMFHDPHQNRIREELDLSSQPPGNKKETMMTEENQQNDNHEDKNSNIQIGIIQRILALCFKHKDTVFMTILLGCILNLSDSISDFVLAAYLI